MDLLLLQPGETLGGVWWNYTAFHGPIAAGIYRPQNSVTIMGLALVQDGEATPHPLATTTYDWLWWEEVVWQTAAAGSTEYVWLYQAWGPKANRKAEGMRKVAGPGNATLKAVVATDDAAASDAFVNETFYTCSASALVILPA